MQNRMALDVRTGTLVRLPNAQEIIKEYKTDIKENTNMAKKKKLLVSFDGGNKESKYYYELDEKEIARSTRSCIDIVENDTYALNGLTIVNDIGYDFNTSKGVIETSNENKKHNLYHLGLLVKALIEISEETGYTKFHLAITTPLDGFNNMLEEIKEFYENNKIFNIEKDGKKKTIEIEHIVVRPEMVSGLNLAGKSVKQGVVFGLDLGGLNHQYLKLDNFKTDLKNDSFVGEIGYSFIEENLGSFIRNNSNKSIKDADIMRYVEEKLGSDNERDTLIQKFFSEVYVPALIEDLEKKSFSAEFDKIYLMGGTSERFKTFLIQAFEENGANACIIKKARFANVIGAYKRAKVEIEKIEKGNK